MLRVSTHQRGEHRRDLFLHRDVRTRHNLTNSVIHAFSVPSEVNRVKRCSVERSDSGMSVLTRASARTQIGENLASKIGSPVGRRPTQCMSKVRVRMSPTKHSMSTSLWGHNVPEKSKDIPRQGNPTPCCLPRKDPSSLLALAMCSLNSASAPST